VNGYIVPIRNVEAIINAIKKLRDKTNEEYIEMRKSARNAALNYSWDNYGERVKRMIEELTP
jgi:glycosyltransferase involved in cell wall biosynthesis